MATVVCQGLQSCLESQLVESKTLRLKLSPPKTHFPQPLEPPLKSCFLDYYNAKEFGHKFQASEGTTQKEKDKSLELCTENLGSESGTDITEEDTIFSMSSKAGYSYPPPTREQEKPRRSLSCRKGNSRSFPPPLTTIAGSESLHVRPRREDGRLIIEAVEAPSRHTYFQAERSHGRLRLTLLKDSSSSFDYFNDADSEVNEQEFENDDNGDLVAEDGGVEVEEEEEEGMDGNKINVGDEMGSGKINVDYFNDADSDENEQELENDSNGDLVAEDGGVEEEEDMDGNKINVGDQMGSGKINVDYFNDADSEENEQELENDSNGDLVAEDGGVEGEEEDMDGNETNAGDEMGSGKINQRPSKCKEEKENGLLNLESYWVASSS